MLLLGFPMFALMPAAVGLCSVVSYPVSCRFKELGIRMALGAGRGRIVGARIGREYERLDVGSNQLDWRAVGILKIVVPVE